MKYMRYAYEMFAGKYEHIERSLEIPGRRWNDTKISPTETG
jgi:hypothetical protein